MQTRMEFIVSTTCMLGQAALIQCIEPTFIWRLLCSQPRESVKYFCHVFTSCHIYIYTVYTFMFLNRQVKISVDVKKLIAAWTLLHVLYICNVFYSCAAVAQSARHEAGLTLNNRGWKFYSTWHSSFHHLYTESLCIICCLESMRLFGTNAAVDLCIHLPPLEVCWGGYNMVCGLTYTYIHTYIHSYIHTCVHTYIHTYRHTYI